MRPRYADLWLDIAALAATILDERRAAFRALEAEGNKPSADLITDGAAWSALDADWQFYTRHARPHDRDVSVTDKLDAIDRETARIDDLWCPDAANLHRQDLLEAMRFHAQPRPFGIAFCVSVTIEARRRRRLNENIEERKAA